MAFPTIPTVAAGRVLSALATNPAGTHTSPSLTGLTKNSGDLLLAIVILYDGNSTNAEFSAWGGGFTELPVGGDNAGTATMAIGVAYKWSTGSETGTFTVTSADASANDSAFFLLSIPGAHATTPPEAGGFATGTGAANPGAVTPSWGAEDTLWIAVGGSGETSTTGSYTGLASAPTSYGNYADSGISADVVGGVEGAVSFRQLNAASENVGAYTGDTSNARDSALVIAVRPAPPPTTTLTPNPVAAVTAQPGGSQDRLYVLSPTPVPAPLAVPTSSLDRLYTLTPDALAAILAIPTPTIPMDRFLTPTPLAAQLATVAPALALAFTLAPDPVAAPTATPTPGLALSYTLTPAPAGVAAGAVSPALALILTLTPSPAPAVTAVPAPAIGLLYGLAPAPVAVILDVPVSQIGTEASDIILTPTPLAIVTTTPTPDMARLYALAPDPAAAITAAPGGQMERPYTLTPAPAPAQTVIPDPAVLLIYGLAPEPVAAVLAIPAPVLERYLNLAPSPVALTLLVPPPFVPMAGASWPLTASIARLGAMGAIHPVTESGTMSALGASATIKRLPGLHGTIEGVHV